MKKYCFACGFKLEFLLKDKPKFCSKCGTPLESGATAVSGDNDNDNERNEENEAVNIPSIDKLDFIFEEDVLQAKPRKLSEVMGTLRKGEIGQFPRTQDNTGTRENAMEEFRREAGTLKKDVNKDAQT